MVVWAIPALTIMLLGGIAWIGSHQLEPSKPLKSNVPAINVQVVSMDWKWLFIYPDQHIATAVYYPTPLHLQPALSPLGVRPGDLPQAERAANEVLYPGRV